MLLFLAWQVKFCYCRNALTLAGDFAGTILSFFLWLNSALIERDFQMVQMTNIWLEFKFMSIPDRKCKTLFHQYSYDFWPWFPALSLVTHTTAVSLASHQWVRVKWSRLVWLRLSRVNSRFFGLCTTGLKNLMRVRLIIKWKCNILHVT